MNLKLATSATEANMCSMGLVVRGIRCVWLRFESDGARHLIGCFVNVDDLRSKFRVLARGRAGRPQ